MSFRDWEKKVLDAPGASERVAEIENEFRLVTGLTALREQAGLTHRELATRLGVSQPRVAAIERAKNLTIEVLNQYVEAVGGQLEVSVRHGDKLIPLTNVAATVGNMRRARHSREPTLSVEDGRSDGHENVSQPRHDQTRRLDTTVDDSAATRRAPSPNASTAARSSLRILVLCDEWLPRSSSISNINRRLCVALSSMGHDVNCAIERAGPQDLDDAAKVGVTLAVPTSSGQSELRSLLTTEEAFDIILGHDRVTGPQALLQKETFFPDACLVQVMHTWPDEAGRYWRGASKGPSAETMHELLRLCSTASFVAAIGPRLTRKIGTALYDRHDRHRLLELTPSPDIERLQVNRRPPSDATCLFVSHSTTSQTDGLDIAMAAVASVRTTKYHVHPPTLTVRGAPRVEGYTAQHGLDRRWNEVVDSDWALSEPVLDADLHRASVVLMPSRSEEFGLAGLEALERGTPVLISSRSGLANLLREKVGRDAEEFIVDVRDDASDVASWSTALERLLRDREEVFQHAEALAGAYAKAVSWKSTVNQLCEAILADL